MSEFIEHCVYVECVPKPDEQIRLLAVDGDGCRFIPRLSIRPAIYGGVYLYFWCEREHYEISEQLNNVDVYFGDTHIDDNLVHFSPEGHLVFKQSLF